MDTTAQKLYQYTAADLFKPEVFKYVKLQTLQLMEGLDYDEALLLGNRLGEILKNYEPDSPKLPQYLVLRRCMFQLKALGFCNMSVMEQSDFIKKQVVDLLEAGIDVQGMIFDFLHLFSDGKIYEAETKNFLLALQGSQAVLGRGDFSRAEGFRPTVANWLQQYQIIIANKGTKLNSSGAFYVIQFLDNNPYVKLLAETEKQVLKALIELWEWLKNPVVYVDENEQAKSTAPYITENRFALPEDIVPKATSAALPSKTPVSMPVKPIEQAKTAESKIPKMSVLPVVPKPVRNLGPAYQVKPPTQKKSPVDSQRLTVAEELIKKNLRKAEEEEINMPGLKFGGSKNITQDLPKPQVIKKESIVSQAPVQLSAQAPTPPPPVKPEITVNIQMDSKPQPSSEPVDLAKIDFGRVIDAKLEDLKKKSGKDAGSKN